MKIAFDTTTTICLLIALLTFGCSGDGNSQSNSTNDTEVLDSTVDGTLDTGLLPDIEEDTTILDASTELVPNDALEVLDLVEDTGITEGFHPVPATVGRPSTMPVTGNEEVLDGIYSAYRKDFYLDNETYPTELEDDPLDGGRFHIAALSQISGHVSGVFINDIPVEDLLSDLKMDWRHVWPEEAMEGRPIWFAFHSRDPMWDTVESGTIRIETDAGLAVDGTFSVGTHPFQITYVTLDDSGSRLLVHVKNDSDSIQTVNRVLLNGTELLESEKISVPKRALEPGETALWTVDFLTPPVMGSAWTLALEFEDLPSVAAVGRFLRPFFPVEAWQKGGDCPFPGVNDDAFELFTQGGLDTFYAYWGTGNSCGYENATMLNETMPSAGIYALLGDDFNWNNPPVDILTNTSAIAGVLTGDESDWSYVTEEGTPAPENKALKSRKVWRAFPELTTYNGAMTNKHIGAFAGMADVQGLDVYAAGCAPHIFKGGDGPSLRAPYDFLKDARNNHMPWPTWLYSQGMGGWTVMPDPQELMVQGLEVLLAGGKGLMWFQVGVSMSEEYPDSWQAISDMNWMVRGVRRLIREGDLAPLASSDENTVVDAIRSLDAIVVPIITLDETERPTNDKCVLYALDLIEEEEIHWLLNPRTVDISVTIPEDVPLADIFEVRPDGVEEISYSVQMQGRTITLLDVPLDNEVPGRVFVFATHDGIRAEVAANLVRP